MFFRHTYGYYDDSGMWQRTKFCMVQCKDCNCGPPGGVYQLSKDEAEQNRLDRKRTQESWSRFLNENK